MISKANVYFRSLFLCVLGLCLSFAATAATVSQSFNLSSTPNINLNVSGFDSNLGTLNAVALNYNLNLAAHGDCLGDSPCVLSAKVTLTGVGPASGMYHVNQFNPNPANTVNCNIFTCPDPIDSNGNVLGNFSFPNVASFIDAPNFLVGVSVIPLALDGNIDLIWAAASGIVGFTYTYTPASVSTVPVPAAAWLFGSGLLGLIGVARRKAA